MRPVAIYNTASKPGLLAWCWAHWVERRGFEEEEVFRRQKRLREHTDETIKTA